MPKIIKFFARIAVMEAISYMLLLGIAMPLKYFFQMPVAVTVVGWVHGVFFMLYMVVLIMCWREFNWSLGRAVYYFIASLLPIVPFYIERQLKQEYTV